MVEAALVEERNPYLLNLFSVVLEMAVNQVLEQLLEFVILVETGMKFVESKPGIDVI